MTSRPRNGRGSNQYQAKPGGPSSSSPTPRQTIARAAFQDVAPDDVAWAFHPDRAAWEHAGMTSRAEALPWINAGITAHETGGWLEGKIDPGDAVAWKAVGAGWEDAMYWESAGFDPPEFVGWSGAGFTVDGAFMASQCVEPDEGNKDEPLWDVAARECERIGGVTAANDWFDSGFDLSGAVIWCESNVRDPALATNWHTRLFSPEDAAAWIESGVEDPAIAAAYRAAGHQPTTWASDAGDGG